MNGIVVGDDSVCRSVGVFRSVGRSNIGSCSDDSNKSLSYQCVW